MGSSDPDVDTKGLTDTVVRGAGLAGAGYVLAQGLTLASYLVLARLATPADFGAFAAGSVLIGVGGLFTESGMMAAVVHRRDRIDEAASTAVLATAGAGLVAGLVALAASPLVGLLFESGQVARIAAAMSGILLVRAFQVVPEALMQRRFSFLRRLVIQPAGALGFGAAAVIAASNDLGPWSLVIGFYAAAVTDIVLSWALVRWRPRLRLASVAMWRELVGYGRHVFASQLLRQVRTQVPIVVIGRFLGASPLGQYRYADRMSITSLTVVIDSVAYVLFPALARITEDRGRFRAACTRSLRLMSAVAFPLSASLLPLGVPSAVLLFGEEWREAGYAAMALTALPVSGAVVAWATEVFKADGVPAIVARMQVVILAAGAVAMVALLPLDLIGVCLGVGLGSIAGSVYALANARDSLGVPVRDLLAEVWPQALAALSMAVAMLPLEFLVVHAADRDTALGLLLLAVEGALVLVLYMGFLLLIARDRGLELLGLALRMVRRRARV